MTKMGTIARTTPNNGNSLLRLSVVGGSIIGLLRTLIFATVTATLVVGGAAAAEKKVQRTHHYFWVAAPPPAPERCDPSQLAHFLHEANLCSADQQTLVPDVLDRR
jgi:hypothetical protein